MKRNFDVPEVKKFVLQFSAVMDDESPEMGGGAESGDIPE